jgi:hypothetical protein
MIAQARQESPIPVRVETNAIAAESVEQHVAVARERLLQIQRAHAVVTTRLHVALPALALGTPVLMICGRPWDPRLQTYLPWLDAPPPGRGLYTLRQRLADGWPSNPTHHVEHAEALTARCRSWVAERAD